MSTPSHITVLIPEEGESWNAFIRRIGESPGELLVVLSGRESELLSQPETRALILKECRKHTQAIRIATKHPVVAAEARGQGLRVLDRTKFVKQFLQGHPQMEEALRVFSPHLWKQQLSSRLQHIGLLSVPKLRIYLLVALSAVLFFFVVFRLLPSADIRVIPRQEPISQTMNIFLVQSGATARLSSPRVRTMPLIPLKVTLRKSLTFDHISKEFIGTSARIVLTVINTSKEVYSFRKGTRFSNQAGMVFRIVEPATVAPGASLSIPAEADDVDLYGQIIGERGNVPAGLKWDIPGISQEERAKVYAENKLSATGGTTAYRTVLKKEDIQLAQKKLEQELLNSAKQLAEERRQELSQEGTDHIQILEYSELTKTAFSGFVLPIQFIGQSVQTIPVEGSILYTVYAYNSTNILNLLIKELQSHVREDKYLLPESLLASRMDVRVIDYDDDFAWIKLTVDLSGTEQYVLDPLSPTGALFDKRVREKVIGLPKADALRIIKNMPEVDDVSISLWPPWSPTLPPIPSHLSISSEL